MSTLTLFESIDQVIRDVSVLNAIKVILIIILCILVSKKVVDKVKNKLHNSKINVSNQDILLKTLKALLYSASVIIIVGQLGVNVSSLLLIFGVVLVVFLFASEDFMKNVACGMAMSSSELFKRGDVISIGGQSGTVIEIKINCVKIETIGGEIITIPFSLVSAASVTNYSTSGVRRVLLKIMASYEYEPEQVIDKCLEMIRSTPGVVLDKPVNGYVSEYGESNIQYELCFWVKWQDFLSIERTARTKLYQTFKEEGIKISGQKVDLQTSEDILNGEKKEP